MCLLGNALTLCSALQPYSEFMVRMPLAGSAAKDKSRGQRCSAQNRSTLQAGLHAYDLLQVRFSGQTEFLQVRSGSLASNSTQSLSVKRLLDVASEKPRARLLADRVVSPRTNACQYTSPMHHACNFSAHKNVSATFYAFLPQPFSTHSSK